MSVDLSALGNLQAVDLDLTGEYAPVKESTFRLPKRDTYTLKAKDSFSDADFGRTKAGALSIAVDPTMVEDPYSGLQIRFTKVSAKPFKRSGITVSQAGDYLLACGVKVKVTDEQELADAIEQTAGRTFRAVVDWRAYNSRTGQSLQGMTHFPKDPTTGEYLPYFEDATEKDPETGKPVRVRANLIIDKYLPAAE